VTRRLKCECGDCRTCRYREYERTKYRLEAYGKWEPRRVDPAPRQAKIRALKESGWSTARIAEASGLTGDHVRRLLRADIDHLKPATAARIDSLPDPGVTVPATPRPSLVDATGTVRRVRALLALGWRHKDLKAATGLATNVLAHRSGGMVHRDTAATVAAVYDELSMRLGPSATNRTRAATNGYAPPLAWDDHDLDNPDAEPKFGKQHYNDMIRRLPDDRQRLAAEVNRDGVTLVAERYEVTPGAVNRALTRAGYRAVTRNNQSNGEHPIYRKDAA
jgi:hypothetical protein